MKHTPGPWKATLTAVMDEGRHIIANCAVYAIGKRRAFANARLIAAAPDLLAALEGRQHADGCYCEAAFAMNDGSHPQHSPECMAAMYAIAKAKGEAP